MTDSSEKLTIAWHPAFCSAAELDLRSDRANLTFKTEHNLSKEPLRIDLLIIKKHSNQVSTNDIAKIFRKHNIVEYKSPDDGLTIDDFYKTLGYACIYKGLAEKANEIPANEITVSFFREAYPRKLIADLEAEGAKLENTASGIYVIKSSILFPIQIIVIKELNPYKHAGLRILSRNVKEEDIEAFILQTSHAKDKADSANISAILNVSLAANISVFDSVRRRNDIMGEALREFFKEDLEERYASGMQQGIEQGEKQKAKEMVIGMHQNGVDLNIIIEVSKLPRETIEGWLGL